MPRMRKYANIVRFWGRLSVVGAWSRGDGTKTMKKVLVSLMTCVLLASAANAQTGSKSTSGKGVDASAQVQLLAFMAPTRNVSDGSADKAPVTITFEIPNQNHVAAVCRVTPRLRDALLQALFANPIAVADKNLDMEGVKPFLLEATNKTLGGNMVSAVTVEAGTMRVKGGGTKWAGVNGCKDVKDAK